MAGAAVSILKRFCRAEDSNPRDSLRECRWQRWLNAVVSPSFDHPSQSGRLEVLVDAVTHETAIDPEKAVQIDRFAIDRHF
jgi:hypothetical protein